MGICRIFVSSKWHESGQFMIATTQKGDTSVQYVSYFWGWGCRPGPGNPVQPPLLLFGSRDDRSGFPWRLQSTGVVSPDSCSRHDWAGGRG